MANPSEDLISIPSHTTLSLLTRLILALILTAVLLLISPSWGRNPVYCQEDEEPDIKVASGYPRELPADNKSETLLKLNLDNCTWGGVLIDWDGSFSVEYSTTIGKISSGNKLKDPVTLKAGSSPGRADISVDITYCPPGGVFLMGVCSDINSINAKCTLNTTFTFYEADIVEENQDQLSDLTPLTIQPQSGETSSGDSNAEKSGSDDLSLASLYDELEEFLAGEGIEAATPGQVGASGTAIVTLLVGWLVLNQWAGISADKSLEVIQAWKDGERPEIKYDGPTIGAEAELPADYGNGDVGAEGEVPDTPPAPADPDETLVTKRSPVQEGGEDRALRGIKDAQDYDDTLKRFNKDIESFEGKIPDQVKNSEAWKKHVAPKWKKAKDLAKKGELDKARTWLDRAEKLNKVREEVDRDLDHLPSDQREGIVWVERTIKTLAHVASDAYETFILKPIKAVAEKILPARGARVITKSVDEVGQGVSDVGQGIGELARKGGRLVSHGKTQDNLQHTMQTAKSQGLREEAKFHSDMLAGKDRKVPPVYPDWTKSPRKVLKLYENFKKWTFGNR